MNVYTKFQCVHALVVISEKKITLLSVRLDNYSSYQARSITGGY